MRFFGLNFHIMCNERGELLNFLFASGNTGDRESPDYLFFIRNANDKLTGGNGYISRKLFGKLFADGVLLITKIKKLFEFIVKSFYSAFSESVFGLLFRPYSSHSPLCSS